MRIHEIDTRDSNDVREFIKVPFRLYRDCAQWTPPIVPSIKQALNRQRHPFYHHSDAGFFVAEDEGTAVGRIAVLENRRYNDYNKARTAFFYYFDTVEDIAVVRGLFDAAGAWAKARGLEILKGPKGMLRADAYGILVEGFEYPAGMGIPYNYPYYGQILEQIGLEKEIDYLSGYMTTEQQLPERLFRTVERLKERGGFWVKSFESKRELQSWIPKIQQINNEAFTQVWGYYPIDEEEVRMIGQQMLLAADPRLLKVVMKGDDIAGFAFVFPDIAEALKATGGQLWPFGWARLLISLKRTKRLLANGVGLLPQFQGLGGSAMMYVELHDMIRARKATYCEFVQAMETNVKSLGDANMLGVNWHKRHRVYRLPI
ncbi:MAG: hypothetical protein MUF84_00075 [Anaerolineae bacterium]|jgi:hypothetical protein|nr:hypothetical protein [Anaerolineae bacterium]